jgi:hypothetical protein
LSWLDGVLVRRCFQPIVRRLGVDPMMIATLALEVGLAASVALVVTAHPPILGASWVLVALFDAGWLLARRKLPNWRPWKRLGLAFMCLWFLLIGLLSAFMLPGWGLLIALLAAATASAPYFAACALPAAEAPAPG